jgi:uncharacterized protein
MKPKSTFFILILIVVVVTLYYSMSDTSSNEQYVAKIEQQRKDKDHYMRTASDSPFADSAELFTGLNYYPVNFKYRLNAKLTSIDNKKTVILPTSDGKEKRYLEYAYAEFELEGKKNRLLILEIMDMGPFRGTLFLAFGDNTSGNETYGAGRYLDVKKVPGSTSITLDFNEAYNPYCAYNQNFSCPLPPRENLLEVGVYAGEKNYGISPKH